MGAVALVKRGTLLKTAQEAFAALLRDHVGRALRAMGLRGSAGAYLLPLAEEVVGVVEAFALPAIQSRLEQDM